LRGRDIKRWQVKPDDWWLIQIESSDNKVHPWTGKPLASAERIFEKTYPAIHARFSSDEHRQALVGRYDQGKYFWELSACADWSEFGLPKAIVPAITDTMNFASDREGFVTNNKASIFIPPSVPYVVGVCNSSVSLWFARHVFATKQG